MVTGKYSSLCIRFTSLIRPCKYFACIRRDRSWLYAADKVEYPVYQVWYRANDQDFGFQVNSNVVLTLRILNLGFAGFCDTNAFVFRTAINNTELATAGIQAKYLQGRINEVNRIHREEYFPVTITGIPQMEINLGNAWTINYMPEERGVDYVITTSIRLSSQNFYAYRDHQYTTSIYSQAITLSVIPQTAKHTLGTLPFDELLTIDVQRFSEIRAHPQNIVAVSLGHNLPGRIRVRYNINSNQGLLSLVVYQSESNAAYGNEMFVVSITVWDGRDNQFGTAAITATLEFVPVPIFGEVHSPAPPFVSASTYIESFFVLRTAPNLNLGFSGSNQLAISNPAAGRVQVDLREQEDIRIDYMITTQFRLTNNIVPHTYNDYRFTTIIR